MYHDVILYHNAIVHHDAIAYHVTENVALGKEVRQSSTYDRYDATRSVDGNRDADLWNGSCSSTTEEEEPEWALNLGKIHFVSHMAITNRDRCTLITHWPLGDLTEILGNHFPANFVDWRQKYLL